MKTKITILILFIPLLMFGQNKVTYIGGTAGNPVLADVDANDTTRWASGASGEYDTIGIVTDVDLSAGSVTSINTNQNTSIPKVISVQDTLYNELVDDIFVVGYTLSTTWYIKIYSTTAYDSLTVYYIKDDAGQGGGGSGTGNITSSVAQNLSDITDNVVLYKNSGDSISYNSNFTYTDSIYSFLAAAADGQEIDISVNAYDATPYMILGNSDGGSNETTITIQDSKIEFNTISMPMINELVVFWKTSWFGSTMDFSTRLLANSVAHSLAPSLNASLVPLNSPATTLCISL
jgi:hypothetical protein